jgi:hypothetical protein
MERKMARKQTLRKKAKKVTGTIVNSKHFGDEPFSKGVAPSDLQYAQALTWYNVMCSKSDAREYLETYLTNTGRNNDLKILRKVPDLRVSDHAAWIARMLSRGIQLTERSRSKMESLLQNSFTYAEVPKPAKADLTKPQATISIKDRIKDKVSDFIGEFEELMDVDGWSLSMYDHLQKRQLPANLAKHVADFYKPIADEANEVLKKNCDPGLKEGYSHYTSAQLKQRAAFYTSILADCDRYASNNKKVVVRKKKVVTADKKLQNFKHQKESKEFKVVSINPEKILGAEQLITFNARYKTLTHFIAADKSGLDVKGTTILNYDEAKSKSYRIGRNTEEHLETALHGGKRGFAKMIASLKTCTLQHRVNENTILLKV